jgi:hypothetical protein
MRLSMSATIAVLVATAASWTATAQVDLDLRAFIGTWKENPAKTRLAPSSPFTYTFSQDTEGFIVIVRSGVQLRDRVRLDGKDYSTPEVPGRTVSWSKTGDTVYETTIKRDGSLVAKGRWTLTEGGKRLTQETTPARVDDQNVTNVTEYVRTSGDGNTLLGEWKPVSSRSGEADLFVVTQIDAGGLKVFYPRNQGGYTMRADGKEYADTRTNALPDMTTSTEALGPRTLRRTTFRARSPLSQVDMTVSSDGKTLTVTTRTSGSEREPAVFVYEKQD